MASNFDDCAQPNDRFVIFFLLPMKDVLVLMPLMCQVSSRMTDVAVGLVLSVLNEGCLDGGGWVADSVCDFTCLHFIGVFYLLDFYRSIITQLKRNTFLYHF